LKRRIKELEEENCQLALRLSRAGRHVNRLRMERKLLLERLELVEMGSAGVGAASHGETVPVGSPVKTKQEPNQ
jgi:hypothetical protein